VRSKWVFDLGETTRAVVIGDYTDMANSFNGQKVFPGTKLPAFLGPVTDHGGPWDLNGDVVPRLENRNWGASLKLEQKLGDITLTSITAYRDAKSR
ncbi:hypothetical protein, partial [Enterococcus faecalis]|uniref:hypothetical protein n=1 Tax=Enterococcus faecalis TaxID=1351 RepID=UPI00403F7A59